MRALQGRHAKLEKTRLYVVRKYGTAGCAIMFSGKFNATCRLVEACPFIEDCKSDKKADYSLCPMKFLSFDELVSEPVSCFECDSLNEFEATIDRKMKSQDHKDLSLFWMEHLNSHLERFEYNNATRTESRQK